MNRTDRLLAIVLELQVKRRCRAEDLAALFETSKRTIYRDIQALSEAGVPLVAVPGQGYSLMEGYFLPPLTFSADEAAMLLLGSDVMAGSFDAQYRSAAEAASRKISAVLPEPLREDVETLRESILFITPGNDKGKDALATLRRAIADRTTVRFAYHTRHRTDVPVEAAAREVDPYTLAHTQGAWYLSGYDYLRAALRTFRLTRMESLEVLDRTFTRPARLPVRSRGADPRPVTVQALFSAKVARWVLESPSFYTVSEENTPEGLLITLQVRQEEEVLSWLLGWGREVQVLAPLSLCRRIAEEAEAMAHLYAAE